MGAAGLCADPWTCRPLLPLLLVLAVVPWMTHCSEGPATVAGKMYPRGNHWAVGHLMGKKSIERLPETNQDTAAGSGRAQLDPYERLTEALLRHKPSRRHLRTRRTEEDTLTKLSNVLLLALRPEENSSS